MLQDINHQVQKIYSSNCILAYIYTTSIKNMCVHTCAEAHVKQSHANIWKESTMSIVKYDSGNYLDFQVCEGVTLLILLSLDVKDFKLSSASDVGKFKTSDERKESAAPLDALLFLDR